jgi:hypothetical protein
MVFGMTLATYTLVHVVISLAGIGSGLVVLLGLLAGKRLAGWTGLFLATTVATSVTGFGLPAEHFLPSHGVGILSLVALAIGILALYAKHLAGGWRRTYVITSVLALYLNCFVAGCSRSRRSHRCGRWLRRNPSRRSQSPSWRCWRYS